MSINNLPLSFLDPGQMALFIPILAMIALMVQILVRHQQRMAEIMHGTALQHSSDETSMLRQEVAELKAIVHQQTIALDSYASSGRRIDDVPLQKRLEEV